GFLPTRRDPARHSRQMPRVFDEGNRPRVLAFELAYLPLTTQEPVRIADLRGQGAREVVATRPGLDTREERDLSHGRAPVRPRSAPRGRSWCSRCFRCL